MNRIDPIPIEGCNGCNGTAGVWGCPIHSPNIYVRTVDDFSKDLVFKCPHCGKDIRFKVEE